MQSVQIRLEISPELHRQLKHRAVDEGKSLAQLLRELLAELAARPSKSG